MNQKDLKRQNDLKKQADRADNIADQTVDDAMKKTLPPRSIATRRKNRSVRPRTARRDGGCLEPPICPGCHIEMKWIRSSGP